MAQHRSFDDRPRTLRHRRSGRRPPRCRTVSSAAAKVEAVLPHADLAGVPWSGDERVCRERRATQQAGFDIAKRPFDFTFGLWSTRATGNRPKAVMGCEPQEPSVVNRLLAVIAAYHNFHVVIKTGRSGSSKMF